MQALTKYLLAALIPLATAFAAEIRPGDSVENVRNTLGTPRGELARGDKQILVYENGEIELQNGVVTKATLRSPDEQAAHLAQVQEENARALQENAARRARLISEGEALKARKLADPNFIASPASVQASFWLDFARAYPDVPVNELLISARNRYAVELAGERERKMQQELIATLETRLEEAEERAAAGPEIVAPISYPYYPIYRRPRHPRHQDEPRRPVNFFPMEYPTHIGLGSSTSRGLPPVGFDPLLHQATRPVIGYDPLLPRNRGFDGHRR